MEKTREQISVRVSTNCIIGNVILSAFKLFAGLFAHSAAMISDAAESLSDVFSTLIVIIGVKMANKEADKEHPYGHDRFESVAAIILSVIVFATGIGIGWAGITKIMSATSGTLYAPGALALVAAVVTIAVKEGMYWYTRAAAKKIDSSILLAGAWHHRSDALSSIGTFAGILGARLGLPVLDPVASLITCLFILKAAINIFQNSIEKMTDKACDDSLVEQIRAVILAQESVMAVDQIKTRLFGDRIYVDVEISMNNESTLNEAHETAHRVHDVIEAKFPKVKHCMVHVSPSAPQIDSPM